MTLNVISYSLSTFRIGVLAVCFFAGAFGAHAQSASAFNYLREYLFIAPTMSTTSTGTQAAYAAGGGLEQLVGNLRGFSIGAGVDLKAIIPGSGKANNTVGVVSFNPYIHRFLTPQWDFYATPGYSFIFRDFTANGWNVGGGFNYWFRENTGFSVEVREEAGQNRPKFVEHHFLEIRVGLTFR